MQFNLVIEVSEEQIAEMQENNDITREDAIKQLTNTFYLGLSCIDGMLNRQFFLDGVESYVHVSFMAKGDKK